MRTLLLITLCLLLSPSVALAERPLSAPRVVDSLAIARAFWGRDPLSCPIGEVVFRSDATDAAFTSPEGAPCSIWIATGTLRDKSWDARVDTCDMIVHEFGHLLGYQHSPDPRSIMYAAPAVEVRACVKRFRPPPRRGWRYSPVAFAVR